MFNLLPKDEKFYDELEELSALVVGSTWNLEAIVDQFPNLDGQLNLIEERRLGARKVFEEPLLRLDKAFSTPIDREDILSLITEMYGVVDRVNPSCRSSLFLPSSPGNADLRSEAMS
jgi:uncharacterized protein